MWRAILPGAVALALALGACGGERPPSTAVRSTAEALSVAEAIGASCSTTIVKGLSEQIVAQSNCLEPGAFVAVPPRPNLTVGGAVNAFLEEPARDAFVAALDAHPGTQMTVNSMLRTVAQQFLLYEWYLAGDCGIGLAATPGASNHETGLAVDIGDHLTWKPFLQAEGFQWLGASDAVHFDYAGPGAVDHGGLDVLAFQLLWNANHPEDPIDADGAYGPQTAARLAQSPADGFPIPPSCAPAVSGPRIELSAEVSGAVDRLADGASAGIVDLLVGSTQDFTFGVYNAGDADAGPVRVRVLAGDAELAAADWVLETDLGHAGTFDAVAASPADPPHGALGPATDLPLGSLAPGETKRVRLLVTATAYSVLADPPPALRLFVVDVPGHYAQAEWGGPVSGDGTQTWGMGRLERTLAADVYATDRFEWETERFEGWSANGPDSSVLRAATAEAGVLHVEGSASSDGVAFAAAAGVRVRVRRVSGPSELRVLFGTDAAPTLSPARSVAFELPGDGAFHELDLGASAHPEWEGTITALALAGGSVDVDWVHGGASSPGDPVPEAAAGCACRATPREGPLAPLALAVAALGSLRRRAARGRT